MDENSDEEMPITAESEPAAEPEAECAAIQQNSLSETSMINGYAYPCVEVQALASFAAAGTGVDHALSNPSPPEQRFEKESSEPKVGEQWAKLSWKT